MQPLTVQNITTDAVSLPVLTQKKLSIDVLRLDKIHPVISGNKWFKLQHYLEEAIRLGKHHIVTFGGAWSNHIVAAAATCKMLNLTCTGIIRGEEPEIYSATLKEAASYGMQFCFISRQDYAEKKIPVSVNGEHAYIIAEGGYGLHGVKGASSILQYCLPDKYTHICCAAGTGTMAAGLLNASNNHQQILAFSVMKNNLSLKETILQLSGSGKGFQLIHDYHFGGYAKYRPELFSFMNQFYKQAGIPLDFVYTAKLLYGVLDSVEKDLFPAGSRILVIHSGGLQGNTSLAKGTLIF